MKLLGTEVVDEDMEREDILEGVEGELFRQERGHGSIVEGKNSNGFASVDVGSQVSEGEIVVEGGELRVFGEDACDVVCI